MSTWRVSRVMLALVLLGVGQRVYGGSATWLGTASSDWLDPTNWLPQTVPNGSSDVAAFGVSTRTTVNDTQTSSAIVLSGITFNAGASAFTITGVAGAGYTLSGAGVTNNSGNTQTFINNAGATNGGAGGFLTFQNSATAANAVINNDSATVEGAHGTTTTFSGTSTAGNATITNSGFSLNDGQGFGSGVTLFTGSSSAGTATVTTNGSGVDGGTTTFGVAGGGTGFDTNATAAHATFIVNGATATGGAGGHLSFSGSSTAANGTFTANGPTVSGSEGGTIQFTDTTTAASAVFTINGGGGNGVLEFFSSSTAGSAAITNNGSPTAAGGGGETVFVGTSAGNATITNNPGAVDSATGGFTVFAGNSTAANGTIINNGGIISGALGGNTQFNGSTPTAGNATLIANGGTNGGLGGTIFFNQTSLGGTSRIEVFGNGSLDLSGHNAPGVTVGSIEGDGNVFLGNRQLSVGSSNASTTFAGSIQNGGVSGGNQGGLTKIGSGTLTLTGASTCTGETYVNAGKLVVNGSFDGDVVVNSGGTLGGSGTTGFVQNNGGTVAPGDPTTLHVNSDYEQDTGGVLRIVIDGANSFDKLAVAGRLFLQSGAILELDFTNGFAPTMGEQFDFLTYNGTDFVGNGYIGSFSQVNIVGLEPGFQYDVQPDGSGNFGLTANNDGVSTSVPEPASLAILGLGGLMLMRRRRLPRGQG